MTSRARQKKVTYTRADRVIIAIAELIECSDFQGKAREAREPMALEALYRAADVARAMRDNTRSTR